jgi:hypothetical protein
MKVLKVEKAHSVFAHLLHVLAAEMTEASPFGDAAIQSTAGGCEDAGARRHRRESLIQIRTRNPNYNPADLRRSIPSPRIVANVQRSFAAESALRLQ